MRVVFVGVLAVMVLSGRNVKADFTFGEPTNLGPTVNSSALDSGVSISGDGLSLYFHSGGGRPGGYGESDIWVSTRATTDDPWGTPVNIGPRINSSVFDGNPCVSADGLSLFFGRRTLGNVFDDQDLWVTTRTTINDDWGTPVNLGATINSSTYDHRPSISADGLSLYFESTRPGGRGGCDVWVTTRATTSDPWDSPVNLGPAINSSLYDNDPSISADGLCIFFSSDRTGDYDLWLSRRPSRSDLWGEAVNLGPVVNSLGYWDWAPDISSDGSTLYFSSRRPGGFGRFDIYQATIIPIVDFNGDRIVDADDMCIMVDHWGEDYPLCDIGPMPWGDGVVDVQDLIVLAEHLFEELPGRPIEP